MFSAPAPQSVLTDGVARPRDRHRKLAFVEPLRLSAIEVVGTLRQSANAELGQVDVPTADHAVVLDVLFVRRGALRCKRSQRDVGEKDVLVGRHAVLEQTVGEHEVVADEVVVSSDSLTDPRSAMHHELERQRTDRGARSAGTRRGNGHEPQTPVVLDELLFKEIDEFGGIVAAQPEDRVAFELRNT